MTVLFKKILGRHHLLLGLLRVYLVVQLEWGPTALLESQQFPARVVEFNRGNQMEKYDVLMLSFDV